MRTADAAATAVSPRTATTCRWMPRAADAAAAQLRRRRGRPGLVRQRARQRRRRDPPGLRRAGLHDIAWRLPAPLFRVFNSRGNWADCIATPPHRAGQRPPGGEPPGRGVGAEQPRPGPRVHARQAKASTCLEQSLAHPARDRRPDWRGPGGEQPRRRLLQARPDGGGARPVPPGAGPEPARWATATAKAWPWPTWAAALLEAGPGRRGHRLPADRPARPSPRSTTRTALATPCYHLGRCYRVPGPRRGGAGLPAAGAGQSPGRGQPAPAGRHAEVPRPRHRPQRPDRPRRASPGLRPPAIFDELGDSAQAAEVRAEQDASGIS